MIIHLLNEETGLAYCGEEHGRLISMKDALDPQGEHFSCKECHKKLTDGQRHSRPE